MAVVHSTFGSLRVRPVSRLGRLGRVVSSLLFLLFVGATMVVAIHLWSPELLPRAGHKPEAILAVLTALASLGVLARVLPLQNVILAATIVFGFVLLVCLLNASTGIPFGRWARNQENPQQLLWVWPTIWTAFLFVSRGFAVFALANRRQASNYGWCVFLLTIATTSLLVLDLEPFATRVLSVWHWNPSPITWYDTPLLTAWGWMLTAGIGVVLMFPAVLDKSPVPKPASFLPVGIWFLLNLLFLAGALRVQLWLLLGLILGEVLAAAFWLFIAKRTPTTSSRS